jgi:hypothetical protein
MNPRDEIRSGRSPISQNESFRISHRNARLFRAATVYLADRDEFLRSTRSCQLSHPRLSAYAFRKWKDSLMHYVSHCFARAETLDRARRWLIQTGFDESCIESHYDGIPRLSVRVSRLRSAQVSMIIRAAETTDPEGWPGIWELARMKSSACSVAESHTATSFFSSGPHSFPMEWHPQDTVSTSAFAAADHENLRQAYAGRGV